MRYSRKAFFNLKSYKYKAKEVRRSYMLHLAVGSIVLESIFLGGCRQKEPLSQKSETALEVIKQGTEQDKDNNIEETKRACLDLANDYKQIVATLKEDEAEKEAQPMCFSQEGIDEIEAFLIKKGYPTINSDRKYPSYLENETSFYDFWQAVAEHKDATQKVFQVSETGGLICWYFQNIKEERSFTLMQIEWDEQEEPYLLVEEELPVLDWEMSEQDNFYFKIYPETRSIDAYSLIRLKAVDHTLYDLNEKYILPIGYLSNNMFLCDWSSEDYGELCLNDLFEFFYKIRNDAFFYVKEEQRILEPFLHVDLPKWLFEQTLMPYFDISLEELRSRCAFDLCKETYPWQEICCSNVDYYPNIEPDIVAYHQNDEGTLTLIINARCNSYKTDCLFTHEVVIRPLKDGSYQYLSNKITTKGTYELPIYTTRMPMQSISALEK